MLPDPGGVRPRGYHDRVPWRTTSPPSSAPPSPIPAGPASCSRAPAPARRGCSAAAWRGWSSGAPARPRCWPSPSRARRPWSCAAGPRSRSARSHETLRVTTFHAYAPELARVHGVERGLLPARRSRGHRGPRCSCCSTASDELDLRVHDLRGDRARLVDGPGRAHRRVPRPARQPAERTGPGPRRRCARRRTRRGRPRRAPRAGVRAGLRGPRPLAGRGGARGLRPVDRPRPRAAAGATPTAARPPARRARHVLVDEFQDTNHAQAELLYLLAAGGDEPGGGGRRRPGHLPLPRARRPRTSPTSAAASPGAPELRLELNHRSTQRDPGRRRGRGGADPRPRAQAHAWRCRGRPGRRPRFWRAPDPDGQARAVASEIRRLAGEGVPLEEQAVLMRAVRLEARPVAEALERGRRSRTRCAAASGSSSGARCAPRWPGCAPRADPADAQAHLRARPPTRRLGLPWAAAADAVAEAAAAAAAGDRRARSARPRPPAPPRLAAALDEARAAAAAALAPADALREVHRPLRPAPRRRSPPGGAEGAARLAGLAALERLGARDRRGASRPSTPPAWPRGSPALAEIGLPRRVRARRAERDRRPGDDGPPGQGPRVRRGLRHRAGALELPRRRPRRASDIPDALLPEVLPRGRDAHVAEARRLAYVAMTRARRHLVLSTTVRRAARRRRRRRPRPSSRRPARALAPSSSRRRAGPPERALLAGDRRAPRRLRGGVAAGGAGDRRRRARRPRAARPRPRRRPGPSSPPAPRRCARRPRPAGARAARGPRRGPRRSAQRRRALPHLPAAVPLRDGRPRARAPPSAARAIGMAAHAALEAHYRPGGTGRRRRARWCARFAGRAAARGRGRRRPRAARRWRAAASALPALPRAHGAHAARGRWRWSASSRSPSGPHRVHGRVDRVDAHPAAATSSSTTRPASRPAGGARRRRRPGAAPLHGRRPRGVGHRAPRGHARARPRRRHARGAPRGGRLRDGARGGARGGRGHRRRRASSRARRGRAARCDFALICPAQDR